ncbi:ATP-binding cassette sub-family G member 4 isoform X2 [Copidosoma floridanum]|uniref:ATP-binding cassette sub-family G member 4 isoform X2 n=1 Tax=Copidosoma floridanum TaxID=29053 RepID=UPI0006C955C8|nr:ATP-binding cassette sub-family G member 4 isoform X2 [Copidosoma floridanum]
MEVLIHEASSASLENGHSHHYHRHDQSETPVLSHTSTATVVQLPSCCLKNRPPPIVIPCQNNCASQQTPVFVAENNDTPNGSSNGTPFSMTKTDTMDLIFENITYTVSMGWRKGQKEILHGLNGRLPSKQLIALMGPSGAGKSTLLDVLSGYRITGVQGVVYVNGRVRNLDSFRRHSAYITQDDRLQLLLTVLENMRVAADLKLGTDTPKHVKETVIEEILSTLGLYEHMYTMAGRLSGGQRKRLSIALELVNNPTVLFLDEPTTGLDSSSCTQVVNLLKVLARQGRTIICTIHQPSATMFQLFDQVYVLSNGECLYQGATHNLLPYLESVKLPCPMYHNPADYVIELACGEYGEDKIEPLVQGSQNGKNLKWFDNPSALLDTKSLRALNPLKEKNGNTQGHQPTSQLHQMSVLMRRCCIKVKRDTTLTHMRIIVNVCTGIMLGLLFIKAGNDANRVLENYNLLFACLMHHMMTTMMLTVLTFPTEMSVLQKEHFNRWYSLKAYYLSVSIVDIPVMFISCLLFSSIVYFMSDQPVDPWARFSMFFSISLLVAAVAQSFGLMIGSVCNVVNGTFLAPTLSVPMMMFAGFGVSLRDLPSYLKWGSYISYLRYGLEGYVNAIYGLDRKPLDCVNEDFDFCLFKKTKKFVSDVTSMRDDQFWNDIAALACILVILRFAAYFFLRWRLMSSR